MECLTACTLDCPDCCSLIVSLDGLGAARLRGNPDHPVTRGFICAKVKRNFIRRLASGERITHPLRRIRGGWERISREQAFALCAEKIQEYRREPSSILYFHGEGAKGVLKQAGHLFFTELGATRVRGSLCDTAGEVASIADFGSRLNPEPDDILNASAIVLWGRDVKRSSIHTAALVSRARWRGAKVISISPGGDLNAPFSDVSILVQPGTDRFLAAAVLRLFLEREAVNAKACASAQNWDDLKNLLLSQPMEYFTGACGVPPGDVERLFAAYSTRTSVATVIGTGLQRYSWGGENVRFIDALAFVSGNIGRMGGGIYYHINSLENFNDGWMKKKSEEKNRFFRMPLIGDEIAAAHDPPIRMAWVAGSNMVNQAPDARATAAAFEGIEFKVVVDAFLTDTAERADLVLPAALMLEHEEDAVGSYMHSYIHHVAKVFDPPGEARSDFAILSELGRRLDPPLVLPAPDECLAMSLASPYLDVSLAELRRRGFVRAKRPHVPYEGMRFDHADGKYRCVSEIHDEEPAPADFPLRLLTLVRRGAIHSQILEEDQTTPPIVEVSSQNPALSNLDLGRKIYLASSRGRIRVRLKIEAGLHEDVIIYRRGDWMKRGGGANQLIGARMTDIGMGAAYYDEHVRLEN